MGYVLVFKRGHSLNLIVYVLIIFRLPVGNPGGIITQVKKSEQLFKMNKGHDIGYPGCSYVWGHHGHVLVHVVAIS